MKRASFVLIRNLSAMIAVFTLQAFLPTAAYSDTCYHLGPGSSCQPGSGHTRVPCSNDAECQNKKGVCKGPRCTVVSRASNDQSPNECEPDGNPLNNSCTKKLKPLGCSMRNALGRIIQQGNFAGICGACGNPACAGKKGSTAAARAARETPCAVNPKRWCTKTPGAPGCGTVGGFTERKPGDCGSPCQCPEE